MDDLLIGYALDSLTPTERATVEIHLAAHPEDATKLERIRALVAPLAADREAPPVPPHLVLDTVARTAEYLVANRLFPKATPARPAAKAYRFRDEPVDFGWGWRRVDVAVAAAVVFLAVGLGLAGIGKLRASAQQVACQEKMREVHSALVGYSETHGGQFPQVGSANIPVAGEFAAELVRSGHLARGTPVCPALEDAPPRQIGFAYPLGYRDAGGQLRGPRRDDSEWVPILADLPTVQMASATESNRPHVRGQNVLYTNGAVRFATTVNVGVNGDDIYRNDAGLVRAGLHSFDTALGRWADVP